MKSLAVLILLFFPILLMAQEIDSTAIHVVDSLIDAARAMVKIGHYEKALVQMDEAERITIKQLGTESSSYGGVCVMRGSIFLNMGQYDESEKWFLKGIPIRKQTIGVENPAYPGALVSLSAVYIKTGRLGNAEKLLLEAKDIFENVANNTDHPNYLMCLNNLSTVYMEKGNIAQAEPLLFKVNQLMKIKFGDYHPYYIGSIVNIGGFYNDQFKFEEAIRYLLDANRLFEHENADRTHPNYYSCLNRLYEAYEGLGQIQHAERYLLKSMAILKETVGLEHPRYASGLNSLARYYLKMGNYTECENTLLKYHALIVKTRGEESDEFAQCESLFGHFYVDTRQYDLAIPKFINAKHILETYYNKDHLFYSSIVQNLAVAYSYVGNYQAAADLYLESIDLEKSLIGHNLEETPNTQSNLALLYKRMHNQPLAETHILKAREMYKIVQNDPHAEDQGIFNNMVAILDNNEHYNVIDSIAAKMLDQRQKNYKNAATFLSESELINYINSKKNIYISPSYIILNRPSQMAYSRVLYKLGYNDLLLKKGFVLMSAQKVNSAIASRFQNDTLFVQRKLITRQLADEYTQQNLSPEDLVLLKQKNNNLEKGILQKLSLDFAELQSVDWSEIAGLLKADEIAIEFDDVWIDSMVKYVALIVRSGSQSPEFLSLFNEDELSSLLQDGVERKADYVNDLYAWADRGMVTLGSQKKSLYELIWQKIETTGLEGINTIYYSPSGVLHRLNLGAIAVDDETILADRYNLVALNSTRQLVVPGTVITQANDALLVGGVNFEVDSVIAAQREEPLMASRSTADTWTESGTRGGSWSYLKWTEKEVERIASTLNAGGFKAAQSTGSGATEEAIKAIGKDASSPRVLHIATHGFFFPDPLSVIGHRSSVDMDNEPVFKSSDNPMIRSGLILAGGNYAWQNGKPVSPDREDGILTAYEISQMNLSNTELVVLSACETGLGDIQGNEGVYGLQRAFKIAGAK
ncbi:MAG: CHAT domain-containing protein, partial [Saprospiraceae bacterium]|nr:CHAT domain-containing protein [Saprospiraceae bacterium]